MKKILFLIAAITMSAGIYAQAPDFNGTWKLNNSKSKLNEEFSMAPKEILITQQGNEMKVEKHSSFQGNDFTTVDKFTLDGVECINPGWMDSEKKSKAVWADDKLSLKITSVLPMGDNGDLTIVEVYKMDGTAMVIVSSSSSSFGDSTETQVFEK
jgi:hypothetical protein